MNDEQLRAALQAEYLHLQKVIEDFDGRAITIKAWSITFSLVALVGAFASHAAAVFLVSSISAILFWFIEGSWKTFQYVYYERSGDIEEYFRGQKKIDAPFQIGTSWFLGWQSGGAARLKQILFWPHVAHASCHRCLSWLIAISSRNYWSYQTMMTNPAVERTSRIKLREAAHLEQFIDASRPRQRGSRLISCPIGPSTSLVQPIISQRRNYD